MKSFLKSWALAAILMGALAPRAAAQTGSIAGTILDVNGNPWPEVVIRSVSDQGAKQETKTDSAGKYNLPNLRAGIYTVFVVFPPPNDKQAPYEVKCRVQSGEEAKVDLNFKDIVAKQGSAAQEQVKKAEEAKAAYTKSAELDPPNAATAWRNFGISLYNANRLGDAVEPLQKSADLEPKNPQTWYLLGASLVYKMTTKKVGDKEVVQFAPGTIEAYQKAVELDPNGTWGQQAKQGLEQLQLMAPGIDTKVNVKKKKS